MGMYYDHKRKNGMNSKAYYYLTGIARFYMPSHGVRKRLEKILNGIGTRPDKDYIMDRVNYYNKLSGSVQLGENACFINEQSLSKRSAYVLDTQEYLRWFPKTMKWNHVFGDVTAIPEVPAIVKSRPIAGDNANSVLLNLDKVRHFTFLDDKIPFREKENKFIFRGHITRKPHRIKFMEMYFGHPRGDTGIINPHPDFPAEWSEMPPLTLWEHLRYKFVMALEGNDVASNLKWIMSSNSVAVMPRPIYETWFMEGRLIPDYHYIEIKPDYSDLIERLDYFASRPEEAEAIIRNANEYVRQFFDPEREKLISLSVLDKYFRMTGQVRQ